MHKVDSPGATPSNEYTDGDPGVPTEATIIAAKHLNTIQRELVKIVEDAGLTLDDENDQQIRAALDILYKAAAAAPADHGNEVHTPDFVAEGDSRLTDSRTPLDHGNEAHTPDFVAEGDSRLTDSRTPLEHDN
jgi:hypothetical protein